MLRIAFGSLVLLSAVMLAGGAAAAEKNRSLKIGDVGPVWDCADGHRRQVPQPGRLQGRQGPRHRLHLQ